MKTLNGIDNWVRETVAEATTEATKNGVLDIGTRDQLIHESCDCALVWDHENWDLVSIALDRICLYHQGRSMFEEITIDGVGCCDDIDSLVATLAYCVLYMACMEQV